MDKVAFSDSVKTKQLTNKQCRTLKEAGLHPNYDSAVKSGVKLEDFTDWILENVYPEIDFDDAPRGKCIEFACDTFRRTYGSEEEVKNS